MSFIKNIKYYLKGARNNWKVKHRLVIKNIDTHQEKVSFLLTPKNLFVLTTTSILILVFLGVFLIAFTPLKYYLPGHLSRDDYRNYKKIALEVDSLDMKFRQNQQYIDNFYNVLHNRIEQEEEHLAELNNRFENNLEVSEKEQEKRQKAKEKLFEESDMISKELFGHRLPGTVSMPVGEKAKVNKLFLLSPTHGAIVSEFNVAEHKMGIYIKNKRNTFINSVADGVVMYSGFDYEGGNTIMIQHQGNLISIYKHAEALLKTVGEKVKGGEPVARMGDSGISPLGIALYFELWYNGVQVNPLEYIIIN